MHRLFKNTSLYTLGNVLPQAANFLLLPVYTKYLSPDEYGIVNSMQVLQSVLVILFTLSLERSIYRLYWDYNSEEEKKNFLGTITISIICISVFSLILVFIFRNQIEHIYKNISFYPFYLYIILTTFFTVFSLVPMIYLMVKQQANKYIALSIFRFILNTAFILWFLVVKGEGAAGMLKGNLIANLLITPLFLFIIYRSINFKFKYEILKSSIYFTLPMIPSFVVSWVLNLSDRIFIERYFNLSDVGIYSLANRIAGITGLLSSGFFMAYSPLFFQLANTHEQDSGKRIYNYNTISIIVVLLIAFSVSFFSKELLVLVLDKKYYGAYNLVPIMAFSAVLVYVNGLIGLYYQQSKKTKQDMYITIFLGTVNVSLNFLLVPIYSVYGAATSILFTFLLGGIVSYYYAKKKCYFIPFNWSIIIPLTATLITIFLLFRYLINIDIYLTFGIKLIIMVICLLVFIKKYFAQVKFIFSKL